MSLSQMVIIAIPTSAAKVVIFLEEEQLEWLYWGYQLKNEIPIIIEQNPSVKNIIVFGSPVDYIQKIADDLKEVLPDIEISLGEF